jgi:hypothetical protein
LNIIRQQASGEKFSPKLNSGFQPETFAVFPQFLLNLDKSIPCFVLQTKENKTPLLIAAKNPTKY